MTTTISVSKVTKAKFDELRPEGAASADEFLAVLLDYYEEGIEPDYGNDPEAIADAVAERVTGKSVNPEMLAEELNADPDAVASKVASRIDYAAIGRAAAEQTVSELEERR